MKKWGFLRKMVAVDWLFMGMEALEGYWFPKQRILSSISESKREDHQCVRKQMTELVVICKPPQYRKAPPLKRDPRPPQRSPHKLTTPNNQTRQAQLFPITKIKALPPKSVCSELCIVWGHRHSLGSAPCWRLRSSYAEQVWSTGFHSGSNAYYITPHSQT